MSGLFGGGRDKGAERRAQQQQNQMQAQMAQQQQQMEAQNAQFMQQMRESQAKYEQDRLMQIENSKKTNGAIFGAYGSGNYLGGGGARSVFLG